MELVLQVPAIPTDRALAIGERPACASDFRHQCGPHAPLGAPAEVSTGKAARRLAGRDDPRGSSAAGRGWPRHTDDTVGGAVVHVQGSPSSRRSSRTGRPRRARRPSARREPGGRTPTRWRGRARWSGPPGPKVPARGGRSIRRGHADGVVADQPTVLCEKRWWSEPNLVGVPPPTVAGREQDPGVAPMAQVGTERDPDVGTEARHRRRRSMDQRPAAAEGRREQGGVLVLGRLEDAHPLPAHEVTGFARQTSGPAVE